MGGQPRIEVVAGGVPDAATLAALVVALTPRPRPPAASDDAGVGSGARVPAWARASLLEGVGGRPAVDAHDLAVLAGP